MNTPPDHAGQRRTRSYADSVTVSAHDVARVLRQQLPGVGRKKLHKLLYLCQAHHLAALGVPVFNEAIHAYDVGPVVERLWKDEKVGRTAAPVDLHEAALNTVAFVVSRYGSLAGRELEILSHGQDPWTDADRTRREGGSDVIPQASLARYFAESLRDDVDLAPWPADDVIAAWLAELPKEAPAVRDLDDVERLRERARGR
jgi:uncharacterized phage-associated protein